MPAPDYAAEIAALRSGLANSELTIETNGERVTYTTFKEIRQRIDYFENLAAQASASRSGGGYGFSAVAFSRD